MRAIRVSLLLVALAACAWFALGIRQVHEIGTATGLVSRTGSLTPAQSARAASAIRAAGTLDPDRTVDILRARLALHDGNAPLGRQILRRVVRDEPSNLVAWGYLLGASLGDPAQARVALAHIAALDPRALSGR